MAQYYLFNIATHTTLQITPPGRGKLDAEHKLHKLQYAAWGSSGSQLIFIHEFSVYYVPSADLVDNPVKLLNASDDGAIYHLLPDWVYPDGESPVS